jgi:hypothetical protein
MFIRQINLDLGQKLAIIMALVSLAGRLVGNF